MTSHRVTVKKAPILLITRILFINYAYQKALTSECRIFMMLNNKKVVSKSK